MKIIKKMTKNKENYQKINNVILDKKHIEILQKRMITNLRIIEAQLYDFEYRLQHFNSLKQEEIMSLYHSLEKLEATTKVIYSNSITYRIQRCETRAGEILERLKDLKDSLIRKITGIIY